MRCSTPIWKPELPNREPCMVTRKWISHGCPGKGTQGDKRVSRCQQSPSLSRSCYFGLDCVLFLPSASLRRCFSFLHCGLRALRLAVAGFGHFEQAVRMELCKMVRLPGLSPWCVHRARSANQAQPSPFCNLLSSVHSPTVRPGPRKAQTTEDLCICTAQLLWLQPRTLNTPTDIVEVVNVVYIIYIYSISCLRDITIPVTCAVHVQRRASSDRPVTEPLQLVHPRSAKYLEM